MQARKYYDVYDMDDNVIASHLTCKEVHDMTGIEPKCMKMYVEKRIVKEGKWQIDDSYNDEMMTDWDRTVMHFKRSRKPKMLRGW